MIKLLLPLIFGCLLISTMAAVATTPPTSINIASSTCSTAQIKTRNDLGIPSGSKIVCIHQVVNMESVCSQSPDPVFLRIEAKYDGVHLKPIFELKWQTSANQLVMRTTDSSGVSTNLLIDNLETQTTQNSISYFACIDSANSYAYGGLNTQTFSTTKDLSVADYGTLPSLDSAVFYFCNDGTNSASCRFSETIISYQDFPHYFSTGYLWGLTRNIISEIFQGNNSFIKATLIRSYEANENTGTSLIDSKQNQNAIFGSKPPSWSKTNYGVEFTSADQFITIPTFTLSSANAIVASSFTVTMWIRLKSLPSVTSYIFRRSTSDFSKDLFALKMNTNGQIIATVGSSSGLSSSTLNLNQWTHISATFSLKADLKTYYMSLQVDDIYWEPSTLSPLTTTLSISTTDQVRIGGVLATVYKIQIYSPGSHVFSPWLCSETITFGINGLPYFFSCDSSCGTCSGPSSLDCLSCSSASYGIYNSQCQTCPLGTGKGDTLCSSCPDHCQSCSSSSVCDVCSSGYALTSNKLCTPVCSNDCTSCSAPGSCDACSPGFTLSKTKQCLSGFVPDTVAATNGGRTTTDTTTQIATAAGNGNSAGVQAQIGGRIFISIQYLKITYSQDVMNILANTEVTPGKGSPVYVPNIPGSLRSDITERRMPEIFEKYGLSSSFMFNFWKKMTLTFMISAIVVLALSVEFIGTKWKRLSAGPATMVRELAQNYLLSQLYSFTGDVVFYSSLFFRTMQLRSKSELADFILCVVFLLAVFLVPMWHYFIILKYQKIKKSQENETNKDVLKYFQETSKGVKLFFENFHDRSILQQLFMIFLITRDLIFSLLLTILFDHPLPQVLILLAMNIAMIVYIVKKRPFKNVLNFIQQLFYEFLLLFALVVLLVLVGLDLSNSTNENARDILGKMLIMESLLFTYGTLMITVLIIAKSAVEYIKQAREKKAQPLPLQTEETPCNLMTDASPSAKIEHKLSVIELNFEEESSPNKVIDERGSPFTAADSENNSPVGKLLKLQTAGLDETKKIKHKKSKTCYEQRVDDSEDSEVIDKFLELGVQKDDDLSPSKYNPNVLTKRFKFMRKSEM